MRRGSAVIVFARSPSSGRVKTRLAARIGPWRAARLHLRLLRRALATACASGADAVELHGTPRERSPHFAALQRELPVTLRPQRGADLGERMHRALARSLRHHRAVVLIGSDCPELEASDLRRAAKLLRGACDVVLAPAEDGGYALIGARRLRHALFAGVPWGTERVYGETCQRIERAGLRWRALRTVRDVDRPEDLERLQSMRF